MGRRDPSYQSELKLKHYIRQLLAHSADFRIMRPTQILAMRPSPFMAYRATRPAMRPMPVRAVKH